MKQHAKRASWARVLLVPTLLLGSASMAAFGSADFPGW